MNFHSAHANVLQQSLWIAAIDNYSINATENNSTQLDCHNATHFTRFTISTRHGNYQSHINNLHRKKSVKWFPPLQVPRHCLIVGKSLTEELATGNTKQPCKQPAASKQHHPKVAALLHIVHVVGVNTSWVRYVFKFIFIIGGLQRPPKVPTLGQ